MDPTPESLIPGKIVHGLNAKCLLVTEMKILTKSIPSQYKILLGHLYRHTTSYYTKIHSIILYCHFPRLNIYGKTHKIHISHFTYISTEICMINYCETKF